MSPSWVNAYLGDFFLLQLAAADILTKVTVIVRIMQLLMFVFFLELQVTDFSPTHIGAAAALLRGIGYPISLTIAPGLTLTPKLIFPYLATQLIMYAKTSGCMLSSFGFLKASMKVGSTAELAWNLV